MKLCDAVLVHLYAVLQHDLLHIRERNLRIQRDARRTAEELPRQRLVLLRDDVHNRRIANEDERHIRHIMDAAQRLKCREPKKMRLVNDDRTIRTFEYLHNRLLKSLVAPRLLLADRFQNLLHHVAPVVDIRRGGEKDTVRMRLDPLVHRHRLADAGCTVDADDVVAVVCVLQTEHHLLHDLRLHDLRLLDRHDRIGAALLRFEHGGNLLRHHIHAPRIAPLQKGRERTARDTCHLREPLAADLLMRRKILLHAADNIRRRRIHRYRFRCHQLFLLFSIFAVAIRANGFTSSVPVARIA